MLSSRLPNGQPNKPKLTNDNCETIYTKLEGNLVLMILYFFIPLLFEAYKQNNYEYDECKNNEHEYLLLNKRYFILDQQIARYFVQYSECISNPPAFIFNSNN